MKENYFESEFIEGWVENGILFGIYKPNLIITLDIAKKMVADRLEIFGGVIRPMFIDVRGLVSVDTASRKYFAQGDAIQFLSAGAFLVNGLISKFAGTIFLKIDKPPIPTKLFTDQNKAIGWLEQFRKLQIVS